MKMTKQVREMVQAVNDRMKENHIKDESDPVFMTMQWLLLQSNCYHGFNYFTEDGRHAGYEFPVDHLELYIK